MLVKSNVSNGEVQAMYPDREIINPEIPGKASVYLQQALDSLQAPSGCVMLCASSVDWMLKEKGYKSGSLNDRINQAAIDHKITEDMAKWAHQVRLDANDERHADETATMPTPAQAAQSLEFAMALGQFLFVLPSRVTRGIASSKP